MTTAIVVGSGPNGLAGAITLARAGMEVTVLEAAGTIGGGTRTSELTVPGLLHDHCSAFHPMGLAAPFFTGLDLGAHGVQWRWAPVEAAHPLDDGSAGVLHRSLEATCAGLGADGSAWRRVFEPLVEHLNELFEDLMRPILHVPAHPVSLARFGARAGLSATALGRAFRTPEARALFTGAAAHAIHPLTRPATSAIGLMLLAAGHRVGWPVPEGGSAVITAALAQILVEHGGRIETGVRVRSLSELPPTDLILLDVAPDVAIALAGDALPTRVHRAYQRFRRAPGAFKLDLAVEGGLPWANTDCNRAGTVHVGGAAAQVVAAEREVYAGRMPERPFMLVGQQYLADPARSRGNVHPVWAYAHVPFGYAGDATEAMLAQLERFAPGARERIVATVATTPTQWESYNPNFVGGDIITGANSPRQLLARPRPALNPYATGIAGVYLCSAATPPGGGVHGMCGYNAATIALADLRTGGPAKAY
ncbi:NAD(P)/FAD-dependent oxidoreductase [Kocuria sp. cx-455]|uniref:phytoene desaturase family protein n=1 Tax=Kocuria sp. cx-455 TaxID=2771377 RepID=UPI0016854310|nr:NAD(P)/FAD-dependent oxidoreductase [Kocuria sp. cx-455]MBD2764489.1 NAD(P)/FAD-dependent oxidoreductase [Kocuria sp. cx-455]